MLTRLGVLAVLALTALLPMSAAAQDRHALIIGNGAYQNVPALQNTLADAAAYADTFETLGYSVSLHEDLDRTGMEFALADFLDQIRPGDTAVFVYSGHGWSDGRVNYLLPTDLAEPKSERRVKAMSMALQNGADGVVDQLRDAGAAVQVAIIDACRNNIFAGRSGTKSLGLSRGLAVERVPQGAFLIFSAGAGEESLDRLPQDEGQTLSVFTRHFLPKLQAGLYLEDAINDAQLETAEVALTYQGHQQNPAYYDQINGKLCLADSCGGSAPLVASPTPVPADPCARAGDVWADIKNSEDAALLEIFAQDYAQCSIYAHLADTRLAALEPKPAPLPVITHKPLPDLGWPTCTPGGGAVNNARLCAASVLAPQSGNSYGLGNLTDNIRSTAWVEGVTGNGEGQTILIELPEVSYVNSVAVINGYAKSSKSFSGNGRVAALRIRTSRGGDFTYRLSDNSKWQDLPLPGDGEVRWILLEITQTYPGSRWQDTAITELRLK